MKLGWAFFALAVAMALAYGLNRGIYFGSTTHPDINSSAPGRPWFVKDCRYLFPDGIHRWYSNAGFTAADASEGFCPFFQPEH